MPTAVYNVNNYIAQYLEVSEIFAIFTRDTGQKIHYKP